MYKCRWIVQNFAKRRNGFRHFGEVNYSYHRQVVHCDNGLLAYGNLALSHRYVAPSVGGWVIERSEDGLNTVFEMEGFSDIINAFSEYEYVGATTSKVHWAPATLVINLFIFTLGVFISVQIYVSFFTQCCLVVMFVVIVNKGMVTSSVYNYDQQCNEHPCPRKWSTNYETCCPGGHCWG